MLELRFRGSRSPLFDANGSWLGDLHLIGSDGTDLSGLMAAALSEPQSFLDSSREEEVLILLLNQSVPDGSSLGLVSGDGAFDAWIDVTSPETFQPLEDRRVILDRQSSVIALRFVIEPPRWLWATGRRFHSLGRRLRNSVGGALILPATTAWL